MQTWSFSFRRYTPFFLIVALAATLFFLLYPQNSARADRVVLKNGDLFTISETIGEKQLTTDHNVKILFEERDGKILFGKGWGNENSQPGEKIGGTELWLHDTKTGQFTKIHEGFETTLAFLSPDGRIFFTTRNQDLMVSTGDGLQKQKLQEKVLSPNISPDGKKLVYQKLPAEWKLGEYFDAALGLTLLDLDSNTEMRISTSPEDWSALFTTDGRKIIFISPNKEGLSSFFSMNVDGSSRTQLTNFGQRSFTKRSVPVPSEKPLFSHNGKFLIFESDRTVWMLRFNDNFTKVERARQVAYGVNPQWIISGKTVSIVSVPGAKNKQGLLKVSVE